MDKDIKMLGHRLKERRKILGMTQESLAELVNTDVRQIWRWENNKTEPNNDSLKLLAETLDTSSDYLLGLSDDPTQKNVSSTLSEIETTLIETLRRGDKIRAIAIIANANASV